MGTWALRAALAGLVALAILAGCGSPVDTAGPVPDDAAIAAWRQASRAFLGEATEGPARCWLAMQSLSPGTPMTEAVPCPSSPGTISFAEDGEPLCTAHGSVADAYTAAWPDTPTAGGLFALPDEALAAFDVRAYLESALEDLRASAEGSGDGDLADAAAFALDRVRDTEGEDGLLRLTEEPGTGPVFLMAWTPAYAMASAFLEYAPDPAVSVAEDGWMRVRSADGDYLPVECHVSLVGGRAEIDGVRGVAASLDGLREGIASPQD